VAKILYSGLINGIRGRVAGSIFSANGAGPHVRRFNPPIIRKTTAQVDRRRTFSTMGGLWQGLTNTQRSDWNDYAGMPAQALIDSLGNTYYLNGYQWFVSCNCNLSLVGRTPISDAPVIAIPTAIIISNPVITAPGSSGNSIDVDLGSIGSNDLLVSGMWTRGESNHSANIKNFKVLTGVQNGDIVSPTDLGDLQAIFGSITAGTQWFIFAYAQTVEGRSSMAYETITVAV